MRKREVERKERKNLVIRDWMMKKDGNRRIMNRNEENMEGRRVDGKDMRCMILHGGCWWQEWDVLKC